MSSEHNEEKLTPEQIKGQKIQKAIIFCATDPDNIRYTADQKATFNTFKAILMGTADSELLQQGNIRKACDTMDWDLAEKRYKTFEENHTKTPGQDARLDKVVEIFDEADVTKREHCVTGRMLYDIKGAKAGPKEKALRAAGQKSKEAFGDEFVKPKPENLVDAIKTLENEHLKSKILNDTTLGVRTATVSSVAAKGVATTLGVGAAIGSFGVGAIPAAAATAASIAAIDATANEVNDIYHKQKFQNDLQVVLSDSFTVRASLPADKAPEKEASQKVTTEIMGHMWDDFHKKENHRDITALEVAKIVASPVTGALSTAGIPVTETVDLVVATADAADALISERSKEDNIRNRFALQLSDISKDTDIELDKRTTRWAGGLDTIRTRGVTISENPSIAGNCEELILLIDDELEEKQPIKKPEAEHKTVKDIAECLEILAPRPDANRGNKLTMPPMIVELMDELEAAHLRVAGDRRSRSPAVTEPPSPADRSSSDSEYSHDYSPSVSPVPSPDMNINTIQNRVNKLAKHFDNIGKSGDGEKEKAASPKTETAAPRISKLKQAFGVGATGMGAGSLLVVATEVSEFAGVGMDAVMETISVMNDASAGIAADSGTMTGLAVGAGVIAVTAVAKAVKDHRDKGKTEDQTGQQENNKWRQLVRPDPTPMVVIHEEGPQQDAPTRGRR